MKSWQRIAFTGLVLFAVAICPASQLSAQTSVALVDLAQVFESHQGFKSSLDELKRNADGLQTEILQQRKALQHDQESLRTLFTPGSKEFKDKEKEIAVKAAQLEVDANDKMRELMEAEAQLHYNIYLQVNKVIEQYCDQFSIRLVLRFNGAKVQADKPESIMQYVNSPIVFYQPTRDITGAIIQRLEQVRGASNESGERIR